MNDHENWHDEHGHDGHEQQGHDEHSHDEHSHDEHSHDDEQRHDDAQVSGDIDHGQDLGDDAGEAIAVEVPRPVMRRRVACSRPTSSNARQIRLARIADRDIRLALGAAPVPLAPPVEQGESVVTSRIRLIVSAPRVHLPTAQLAVATRQAMRRGAEPAQAARLRATQGAHEVRGLIAERITADRMAATVGATVRTGEHAGARVTERVARMGEELRDQVRDGGHTQRDRASAVLQDLLRRATAPAGGAISVLRGRAQGLSSSARRLLAGVDLRKVDLPKVDLPRVEVVDLREPLHRVVDDLEELGGELRTGAERAATRAGEAIGTVEHRAVDAAHEARERASGAAHEARDRAAEAAQEAREKAAEALTRAREAVHL